MSSKNCHEKSEPVRRHRNAVRREIHNGKTPRAIVLWLLMDIARDYLASRRFHIYRGVLSMRGEGIASLNSYCLDELTKLGLMTEEENRAARKVTKEDIQAAG